MRRFEDKVVLVTGAASGIGEACAIQLASEGAQVACVDIQREATEATAAKCSEAGVSGFALTCDVSDESAVAKCVSEAVKRFGKLDGLCNSAGILRFDDTLKLSLKDWSRILDVNLTGTFLFCREALPHLLETKGAIVNVASTAGLKAQPWSAAYCASKGGVIALTHNLAIDFGRKGVRTNAVCPSGIDTPINQQFHFPEGADQSLLERILPFNGSRPPAVVAEAIAFLLSNDSSYINGVEIRIDGGTLA